MLIVTIPPELIYIIIEFLQIRDIRVLKKIEAFKYYRPIFQKFIEKERKSTEDFYQKNQKVPFEMNIRYDIGTIKMGLSLDSRRWNTYLVNIYKDKVDFFNNLLPNIKEKPIEESIKQFFKIVKIMIEKYGNSVTNNIVSPLKYRPNINELLEYKYKILIKNKTN
jgi:hypothetical protein